MIGIYKITNKLNGKVYIGQAINIQRRWNEHKNSSLNKRKHEYNTPIHCAIRKYGIENFLFEVLVECCRENLNELEIKYIKQYNANDSNYGYNLTQGGNQFSHFTISDEMILTIINKLKTTSDSPVKIGKELGVSKSTIYSINNGEYRRLDSEVYPIRKAFSIVKRKATPKVKSAKRNQTKACVKKNVQKKAARPQRVVQYCPCCGTELKHRGSKMCPQCTKLSQRKVERPEPLELARMIKEIGFVQVGKLFGVSDKAVKKWCKSYGIPHKINDLAVWYDEQMGISPEPCKPRKKKSDIARPVLQIDPLSGETINCFENQSVAAKALGFADGSGIGRVLRGQREFAFGYKWAWA